MLFVILYLRIALNRLVEDKYSPGWVTGFWYKPFHVLWERTKQCEEIKALANAYQSLYTIATKLESKVYHLEADNIRLKHENEFMLRLINERDNKET